MEREGYMLVDVEAAEGYWVGIFAKNTGFKSEAYVIADEWEEVSPQIKAKWHSGYRLVNIEYTAGEWFLLFAEYPNPREDLFANNEDIEDFRETIRKYWKQGYYLVDLADGRD